MFAVMARAGCGLILFLAILGMVQLQSVSDALVAFAAAGVVPGTDWQIPPDYALMAAIGVITLTLAWLIAALLFGKSKSDPLVDRKVETISVAAGKTSTPSNWRRWVHACQAVAERVSRKLIIISAEAEIWLQLTAMPRVKIIANEVTINLIKLKQFTASVARAGWRQARDAAIVAINENRLKYRPHWATAINSLARIFDRARTRVRQLWPEIF